MTDSDGHAPKVNIQTFKKKITIKRFHEIHEPRIYTTILLHVSLLIYKVLHNRSKCNKGRRVNRIKPCHRSLIMLNVKILWISRMNQLPHCVLSLYNTDVSSIWPHVLYFITPLWLIHRMRMSTISTNVGRWTCVLSVS